MHKSQSPVSKKPFIKQPSTGQQKIHYNQLQLPTQLTSDQGQRQIKKNHLKQILVSNIGTQKYQNTHKPSQQSEHEQIKIVIPRIYQNGNQSAESVINDLRIKIEELEGTVRHQDFKINRLQQELLFQRNQYNKLHNKYVQQEMKYNYYPQTCKLIKSSLAGSVEHISNVNSMLIPSLMKLQKGSSKSVHQQSEKIVTKLKQLKFNQQLLIDELKQNSLSQGVIAEVVQLVQEKAKELYEQKIRDLEELLKLQQIFFKDELQRLTNKYNVINIELANIDNIKDGYYEKNLQQSTELGLAPSLVKYGNPVLVSTGQKKLMKSSTTSNTEDILNSILPPREFVHSKQQVQIQCVSAAPSTKQDVLELQEKLDKRLQQRQARETGLCPIREELYSQCFDELIRQITINCAERGLLLVRVRDEVKMVIQTYQTLYASSCAFGMRKFLQEMERKEEMKSKIKQLENECDDLQTQVNSLQNTIRDIKNQDEQRREQNKQNHAELVAQIKLETKNKVTQDLEQYLTGKKKMVEKKQ